MHLRSIAFCFCLALASACAPAVRPPTPVTDQVSFGSCNPQPCVKVSLVGLAALPPSLSEASRDSIYAETDRVLYAPLSDADATPSRKHLLGDVEEQFNEYLEVRDPETEVNWELTRKATLLGIEGDVVSVSISSRGYLGGAHGFRDEKLITFDGKTGKALGWDDLVRADAKASLLKVAEAEFRKVRNIPLNKSLSDAGFFFDEGKGFTLSESFAVTKEGLVLHYNPYEVGPYVMGPTDLVIPMSIASGVLRDDVVALPPGEADTGLLR